MFARRVEGLDGAAPAEDDDAANANANASGGGGRPALASATNGQPRWDALFHSGADAFAPTRAAFKMRVRERLTTDLGASMLSARADDERRARAKEDEKSATTKELVDCAYYDIPY